ncbi:MAG: hypothetical protein IJ666_00990 [Ruminococcus sp.]|nr:hypothetical protein [Ruminococcus sp.]
MVFKNNGTDSAVKACQEKIQEIRQTVEACGGGKSPVRKHKVTHCGN